METISTQKFSTNKMTLNISVIPAVETFLNLLRQSGGKKMRAAIYIRSRGIHKTFVANFIAL